MASYLIEPHKLRLDYSPLMEEILNYACSNKMTLELWPAGQIVPTSCKRINESLELKVFGEHAERVIVLDELEVEW